MNLSTLKKAGFTDGEIRVYTALLELGETSTGAIIKNSKITGSKVYEILEKLKDKGLVSYVTKEKTKYFQAAPPKRILDYIETREKEISANKKEIKSLLPMLEAKQKSLQVSQSAQVFEGWEGLRTVFDMMLSETKKGASYYAMGLGNELKDEQTFNFLRNHHKRRIDQKIKVKLLLRPSDKATMSDFAKLKDFEARFYDDSLPLGIYVFGDYVATITFSHKTAFLIKSEYVANSYRDFFDEIWKKAKS